jgi:TonB family C-terminal domain
VVAEHAEIVVAQKPVTPEKPIVKKAPPRQTKPVEKPRPAVEKVKPAAPVVVSAPSEAARAVGPVTTAAASPSAGVSQPSSGSAQKVGESAAGNAEKGAGSATSTRFRILHRRVNYPTRARSMGVEGQVRVKYDVTASGTITNIQILAENPPDVFSSDLRRDISRWRYDTTGELKNQIVTVIFKIDGRIQVIN